MRRNLFFASFVALFIYGFPITAECHVYARYELDNGSSHYFEPGSTHLINMFLTSDRGSLINDFIIIEIEDFTNFTEPTFCPTGWIASVTSTGPACTNDTGEPSSGFETSFYATAGDSIGEKSIVADFTGTPFISGTFLYVDDAPPVIDTLTINNAGPIKGGDLISITLEITDNLFTQASYGTLIEYDADGNVLATHKYSSPEIGGAFSTSKTDYNIYAPAVFDSNVDHVAFNIEVYDKSRATTEETSNSVAALPPGAGDFSVEGAYTQDVDVDGKIDLIVVPTTNKVDGDKLNTASVSVTGYVVADVYIDESDSSVLKIALTEGGVADTDATPTVIIDGLYDIYGQMLTNGEEIIPADKAPPIMVSAEASAEGLFILVHLSEDINGSSLGKTDFNISSGEINAVSEPSAGTIEIELSSELPAGTTTLTLFGDGEGTSSPNGIKDLAEVPNWSVEHSIEIEIVTEEEITDNTPPALLSVSIATLATTSPDITDGDEFTISFISNEKLDSASVEVFSAVEPATSTDGINWQFTKEVSDSNPAGKIVFLISVADLAGNTSIHSETTDSTYINIVRNTDGNEGGSGGSETQTTFDFEINLYADAGGWNFIALSGQPSDSSIDSLFADMPVKSVWTYDPDDINAGDSGWLVYYPEHSEFSSLKEMKAGHGYFVEVSQDSTLSVSGASSLSDFASRELPVGWSMLGAPFDYGSDSDITDFALSSLGFAGIDYNQVVGLNNKTGESVEPTEISPGDAMWVYMTNEKTYRAP